jgi:hypothetical protein
VLLDTMGCPMCLRASVAISVTWRALSALLLYLGLSDPYRDIIGGEASFFSAITLKFVLFLSFFVSFWQYWGLNSGLPAC